MTALGVWYDEKGKTVKHRWPEEQGVWNFDEDDYLLLAMLADPVYCAELLGEDASNHEYGGMFVVRDYQYPLFRTIANYAGFTCARTVGKTESIKWKAVSHAFRRIKESMLITAPELIHLLPLTEEIEDKIESTRITREFLDTRNQKTGFSHRPFGVDYADGTKIFGRIPRLDGRGVKGMHEPDLLLDEAQDYPDPGWTEVHETVMKDHTDRHGNSDFTYHFYGVHSGAGDTGFANRAGGGAFKIINITAIQRPGWNKAEKDAAIASYGGTTSPDYRRNILGEPGGASSPFFVLARLVACLDQDRDSPYNQREIRPGQFAGRGGLHQLLRSEELDEMGMEIEHALDLPSGNYDEVYGGMDVGLTSSPSVITLFSRENVKKVSRLKLIRRFHLERMRPVYQRRVLYAIARHFGGTLKGFGIDSTGLGLPFWQDIQDDENAPPHLLEVSRGYFFNAKVPVAVDQKDVTKDPSGRMRDRFGAAVVAEIDPATGQEMFVTYMPMIEASTRYLRAMVDSTFLMLPFDTEITRDMSAESQQRVARVAGLKNKPNAFHILDSMRAMAMVYNAEEIEAQLGGDQQPVFDYALDDL